MVFKLQSESLNLVVKVFGAVYGWVGALISVVAGAIFSGMGAMWATPEQYDMWTVEGQKHLATVAMFTIAPVLVAFLIKSPLPGIHIDKAQFDEMEQKMQFFRAQLEIQKEKNNAK